MEKKPNIILITTDTQRCDTLKCMGNPHAISPNLDKLAREGVLFTQAHTASPVCMPARCSLLTGLHTPIHGCIENGIARREDIPVFTDYLKEQGYVSIMVGKTHFGLIPDSFDIRYIIEGEKSACKDDCYSRHIKDHGYERASSHPNPIPEELFMDAFLVDTTIDEIKKIAHGDRPFFAFCSLLSPHSPVDPPGNWAGLYEAIPLPDINYAEGEIEEHPEQLRMLVGTMNKQAGEALEEGSGKIFSRDDLAKINHLRQLYYGLASYCDAQIGRLIRYLDESGLRENTLVIFTSDHGQQYYDHGFNDKHNYYDSSWRVPLIMSMPGTLPSGERRKFAVWNDITTTILAAAGTYCSSMQGFDLFTPLKSGEDSPRKCAIGTLYKSAALATEKWKLEYYFETGKGRLFDRVNDPLEQKNIYDDPDFSKVAGELTQAILTWRSDICDVNYLIKNTGGGGPVARRIAPHTLAMKGIDSEERLNKAAERVMLYEAGE